MDCDKGLRGRWRVELDGFSDGEVRRKIVDCIQGTRGVFLFKAPVEVPAAVLYCEELCAPELAVPTAPSRKFRWNTVLGYIHVGGFMPRLAAFRGLTGSSTGSPVK